MRPKMSDPARGQVNIHLTEEKKKRLGEIARLEHRPLAQMARIIVEEYVDSYGVGQQAEAAEKHQFQ